MTDNLYFERKYRTLMEDNQQNKPASLTRQKFIKKAAIAAVAGTSAWIAGCKDEQKYRVYSMLTGRTVQVNR